jgi:tRNA threonylcarbamoyladenosine biosynthesis protein TsaE
MNYISCSLKETESIAREILVKLIEDSSNSKDATGATILGLYGDLGSGKTAFTQVVAKILGVGETVTSPTFVIEKIYEIHSNSPAYAQSYQHLIHIDAYRIESSDELTHLGWQAIIENPKNLILIEWPEKVADIMPVGHKKIHFTFLDETTRKIEF